MSTSYCYSACRTVISVLSRTSRQTKDISHIFRGPAAPLTSLALSTSSRTLLAGCWDKAIWSWDVTSRAPRRKYLGHSDFVKAVVCVRAPWASATDVDSDVDDLLITGGADASIIVWRAATAEKLHVLKGHARGILSLQLSPEPMLSGVTGEVRAGIELYSAGSDPEMRRWSITSTGAHELVEGAIHIHETSINAIRFHVPADAVELQDVELWTASADKTAQCLTPSSSGRWESQTTLPHPDFVRDLVVVPNEGLVVTACRDENVRVWDAATGRCLHTFEGHYEEVTGLAAIGATGVVSVGIDGTIRRWSVTRADVLRAAEEAKKTEKQKREEEERSRQGGVQSLLTAEEEAELAALMEDDSD